MVRALKELDVDVWFERENIHSLSADGEFMLTILASFAQEESLSASENQKWRIRKNFSEGVLTTTIMYGYNYEHGTLHVIPEEADVIRMIFSDYLSGMGVNAIVRKLCKLNIPAKHGGIWNQNVVQEMLQNEKYKGDLLLQKTFISDHISKKQIKNEGQLPKYYVENAHEAIIEPAVFDAVQSEIQRRSTGKKTTPKVNYPFTSKIVCEKCGKSYRRRTTSTGAKWCCATYNTYGKAYCDAQQIPESVLEGIVADREFKQIKVPCAGEIKVIWMDGSESVHHWQNPSRADSWTEDMRRAAGERSKAWHESQSQ